MARQRDTRQVLDDHLVLRERGHLDEDLRSNYHPDVVILTPSGGGRGHEGVRRAAQLLYEAVKDSQTYEYDAIVTTDRVALLEWSARGAEMTISDGVDTFLIEGGLIHVQTIRYTVTFSNLSQARKVV